jgi:hypothetical protein
VPVGAVQGDARDAALAGHEERAVADHVFQHTPHPAEDPQVSSVLGAVSVGSVAGAFGLLAHWGTHRRDALGRERDLPVLRVSALVLVAVLAAVPGAQRKVQERQLGKVASQLAQRHVSVHCQDGAEAFVDAGSELGWVAFGPDGVPEPRTLIKREQCKQLRAYTRHPSRPSIDEVIAVHVLTHEAMHMRGERSEEVTECQAVQRDALTAHALGASTSDALMLARRYWGVIYPQMPEDYTTGDCSPGGALDEKLDTSPWPAP